MTGNRKRSVQAPDLVAVALISGDRAIMAIPLGPANTYGYPLIGADLSATVTPEAAAMASGEAGEPVPSSWVPEDRVPAIHRAWVRRHVDRAAQMLGLEHVRIRWFGPFDGSGGTFQYGRAPEAGMIPVGFRVADEPMTIAINAHVRGDRVKADIAHEVRHIWQAELAKMAAQLGTLSAPNPVREADADSFAALYIGREDPE